MFALKYLASSLLFCPCVLRKSREKSVGTNFIIHFWLAGAAELPCLTSLLFARSSSLEKIQGEKSGNYSCLFIKKIYRIVPDG